MFTVRNSDRAVLFGLVQAMNKTRVLNVGSVFHYDQLADMSGDFERPTVTLTTVTAAAATNLATSITLANQLKAVFNRHIADALDDHGCGAHAVADATNVVTTADAATLLAEVQTLLNAIKTKFNAHLTQASVHANNDGTNTEATADATDQTTANALATSLKAKLNAHMASAPAGHGLRVTAA